jgi:hypothetical protein
MPTLFLLAALITVAMGLIFFGFLVIGVALCFVRNLRFVAPYFLLVPTLFALGAVGGSWGFGYLTTRAVDPTSVLPFWAYVLGLPAGGIAGLLAGIVLASRFSRRITNSGKYGSLGAA